MAAEAKHGGRRWPIDHGPDVYGASRGQHMVKWVLGDTTSIRGGASAVGCICCATGHAWA